MKTALYERLLKELPALFTEKTPWLTLLANLTGELKARFPIFSWVGFYLYDGEKLRLGPYQGLPACEEIELTRGVCGAAATTSETILVKDVHLYPGHIACDALSRSEIVIPLMQTGRLLGVFDIDSYQIDAFDAVDQVHLEKIARFIEKTLNLPTDIFAS